MAVWDRVAGYIYNLIKTVLNNLNYKIISFFKARI